MKIRYLFVCAMLLFDSVEAEDQRPRDLAVQIDALVMPYVELGMFNGVILVARNDETLFERGYGMASYEHNVPNTPTTKFRIASISKNFTGLAVATLVEQGKLAYNTRVSEVLPDFPNGDRMTVEQMLDHTAGLARLNNLPEYNERMSERISLEELVQWVGEQPLLYEPGTDRKYSSSYLVLARMIEVLSGQAYGDYMMEAVLSPMGMNDTGHEESPEIYGNMASAYMPGVIPGTRQRAAFVAPEIKTGGGSLYSTARDLWRHITLWHNHDLINIENWNTIVGPKQNDRGEATELYIQGRAPGYFSQVRKSHDTGIITIVLANNYSWGSWAQAVHQIAEGEDIVLPDYQRVPHDPQQMASHRGKYKWENFDGLLGIDVTNGQLVEVNFERRTLVGLIPLKNNEWLMPSLDLICQFEPEALTCRSHWHDNEFKLAKQ